MKYWYHVKYVAKIFNEKAVLGSKIICLCESCTKSEIIVFKRKKSLQNINKYVEILQQPENSSWQMY